MGSCNTKQKESSGNDLLLKRCKEIEVDVQIGTGDDPTEILIADFDGQAGDLIRFGVEALGTVSEVNVNQIYFIKEVTADGFKISASPGGAPITFTHAVASLTVEHFETVGGLRSKSYAFNSEAIDVSNHGSNQWREIKDGAGMRSVSISGGGVYSAADSYRNMENDAFANKLQCLAFVDVSGGRAVVGCFKVTSNEASGDYDGESAFSMSAESSGEVKIYQAVA